MKAGELKLVAITAGLITSKSALTTPEKQLIRSAGHIDKSVVAEYRERIVAGEDILGTE